MTRLIYKILRCKEWEDLLENGRLVGSPDDIRDGFIHFSTAAQVSTTLDKRFANDHNLILLAAEIERLGPAVRWEISRGGASFPHFYGVLTLDHVHSVAEIRRGDNGRPILPPDIPG